ncbi:hypothetical protein BpHYR1_017949 [Brachionus plicatilis]|uniref:Uncharacterized protein n=1 Tax=Brachionus plicatilis TaxID=10195 RepID=A0A3M7P3B6_BRAPC|nr:hypothetical protein BpHYR1_017949 [Brachionus plicatilis]
MHPILQISIAQEYLGAPSRTSGALYHKVTTSWIKIQKPDRVCSLALEHPLVKQYLDAVVREGGKFRGWQCSERLLHRFPSGFSSRQLIMNSFEIDFVVLKNMPTNYLVKHESINQASHCFHLIIHISLLIGTYFADFRRSKSCLLFWLSNNQKHKKRQSHLKKSTINGIICILFINIQTNQMIKKRVKTIFILTKNSHSYEIENRKRVILTR